LIIRLTDLLRQAPHLAGYFGRGRTHPHASGFQAGIAGQAPQLPGQGAQMQDNMLNLLHLLIQLKGTPTHILGCVH
jgi:hypothetical protein